MYGYFSFCLGPPGVLGVAPFFIVLAVVLCVDSCYWDWSVFFDTLGSCCVASVLS